MILQFFGRAVSNITHRIRWYRAWDHIFTVLYLRRQSHMLDLQTVYHQVHSRYPLMSMCHISYKSASQHVFILKVRYLFSSRFDDYLGRHIESLLHQARCFVNVLFLVTYSSIDWSSSTRNTKTWVDSLSRRRRNRFVSGREMCYQRTTLRRCVHLVVGD